MTSSIVPDVMTVRRVESVGVAVSTSSSIFIATPILLFLGEKRLRQSPVEQGAAEDA